MATIRYRRKSDDDPDPPQIQGNHRLELAWTIAPAILLIIVAVPTIQGIFFAANLPEDSAFTVEATGHQWWFEFNYPDQGIVTANELHIPVGQPIGVDLFADDVIHSFWVPKLAGKVDMMPGNKNFLWLEADEPGVYFGQCAEFCGESHARMRFRVIAHTQAEFDAWVQKQKGAALIPADPLAREGYDLFVGDAQCWACHTITGIKKAKGTVGPNLSHFASRMHLAAGVMDNTQENLRAWLEDPNDVKPGNIMSREAAVYTDSSKRLSEPEISALAAFLRSLD
jgi:cytochrome c oxidase subunit 2